MNSAIKVNKPHLHGHTPISSLATLLARLDAQEAAGAGCLPNKTDVHSLADGLFNFLFPINCAQQLSAVVRHQELRTRLIAALNIVLQSRIHDAEQVADAFFGQLPEIYDMLQDDVDASFKFDPAATSKDEVITTYPGFYAIAIYRMAHVLAHLEVPIVPRMLTEYAHSKTGIDIHPGRADWPSRSLSITAPAS